MVKACLLFCGCLCVSLVTCEFGETCKTIDNEVGSCISIEYCKPYYSVYVRAFKEVTLVAYLKKTLCGQGNRMSKVCCPAYGISETSLNETTTPSTTNATTTTTITTQKTCQIGKTCISIYKCPPYLVLSKDYKTDSRARKAFEDAYCGLEDQSNKKIPKVCCPAYGSSETSLNETTTPSTTNAATTTTITTQKTCQIGKTCISIHKCPNYLVLSKYYKTDSRARKAFEDAYCGLEDQSNKKIPKVCCASCQIRKGSPRSASTTTTTTSFSEPPVCGYSNASFTRVVNGIPAEVGDVPWMALLGYKIGGDTHWNCGGSLITSKHVLTAAHCIHKFENDLYVVRLGELDYERDDEGACPEDVRIKDMIKHEKYNDKSFTNDIGILVLERVISFSDFVRPICIPKNTELREKTFVKNRPFVAGWGSTATSNRIPASLLRVAQLRVTSNDFCAKAYELYESKKIDDRVICADSDQGRGACHGDSGGPLMILHKNKEDFDYFYLIGVHSFATRCADANYPGVYTRVTHFLPWIEQKIFLRSE